MITEPEHTPTRPTSATREFERRDARTPATSDCPPTEAEAALAPEDMDPQVQAAYREALERRANQKGEGRIA